MDGRELIIVRQHYTPFGGAERFVANAVEALRERGLRVRVLARKWQNAGDGEPPIRCNPFYIGRTWRDISFRRAACRLLAGRDALVQSHERIPCCDIFRAGDGVHAEWLRQRARKRGRLSDWLTRLSPYHRQVLRAERRMFHSPRLKAVICNSQMVKQEIIEHYAVDPAKLHVIYSGVDSERFHPRLRQQYRQPVRQRFAIPDDVRLCLFVGSGFERKGLDALIRALPDDLWLLVVGKDRKQARYERLARKLDKNDRIVFAGPQTDMPPIYACADLFALPTLYDPFPNAVLEAMASGLPVITSSKSGAVDLIRPGDAGCCCDALDLVELQRSLARYAVDAPPPTQPRQTIASMSREQMSEHLQQLYSQLMHAGREAA